MGSSLAPRAVGAPLLRVTGASKSFPAVKALDDVSLTVGSGEIVAVVGQNGSGKSTLVKILAGVYAPDPGTRIVLGDDGPGDDEPPELHFIHQDLGLVESLTAIENLDLSHRLGRASLLPSKRREEERHATALLAEFGVECDLRSPISELAAGERAILAIARALDGWTHDRNVLVLDEPTAALHGKEVDRLFSAVRRVAQRGAGVVFISHRLDEIFDLADRVVALRDGKLLADVACDELDRDGLVTLIAGSAASAAIAARPQRTGAPVQDAAITVRGLATATIRSLDLDLRPGEIVGIAGQLGSGREDVSGALFGWLPSTSDSVLVDGVPVRLTSSKAAIAHGLAYVPGDRHRLGAVMTMTASENAVLPRMAPATRFMGWLDRRAERSEVSHLMEFLEVRPHEPDQALTLFSGGNQQKVVIAKWLRNDPRVLLMDEPTQGVDVGAKAGIYAVVGKAAAKGAAVLVSSSDSQELAQVCDRVVVMRDGYAVAELSGDDLTEQALIREELGLAGSSSTDSIEDRS